MECQWALTPLTPLPHVSLVEGEIMRSKFIGCVCVIFPTHTHQKKEEEEEDEIVIDIS